MNTLKNSSSFIVEAKRIQSKAVILTKSLEEIDMATKAGQKLQKLQGNSYPLQQRKKPSEKPKKKGYLNMFFDKDARANTTQSRKRHFKTKYFAKYLYHAVRQWCEYWISGGIQFKNLRIQESLQKNNIGVAKHTDSSISINLNDGKLICWWQRKMRIHQKDMSPENETKFSLGCLLIVTVTSWKSTARKNLKIWLSKQRQPSNLPVILKPVNYKGS